MVAETLPQIVRMWKDDDYPAYDGQFFSMPQRNVLPKPYTQPHPPIWMAAGSPSTFELAAKLGVGVLCFAFTPPQVLTPLIAKYKEMIQDCTDPVGALHQQQRDDHHPDDLHGGRPEGPPGVS